MPTLFLLASLIGLALGPVAFAVFHRTRGPQLALDGFVLVAVVGLVLVHVLPHALEEAGIIALPVMFAGVLLPIVVERARALSSAASHAIVLGLAFAALVLHASLDGVGLSSANGDPSLGLAIVLHRLPVGLAVWWLVVPQFGARWAAAVLAALGVGTVAGFGVGSALIEPFGDVSVQLMQAFVAGSLLHVLMHQSVGFHDHTVEVERWRVPGAVGACLGAAVVVLVPGADAHHHFGEELLEVCLAAAPLLVLLFGLGFAGLAIRRRDEFVGRALHALDRATPWAVVAVVLGAMLGEHLHLEPTILQWSSLVLFTGLVTLSLAHQGPREFLLRIVPLGGGDHDHEHHHHHEHDHERQAQPLSHGAHASEST